MDGVLGSVRDLDDATAEAARNGVGRPGPERRLADAAEAYDGEVGIPVHVFLLVEARGDLAQRLGVIARRQHALVARAGEIEIHLEPTGGVGAARRQCGQHGGKRGSEHQGAARHDRNLVVPSDRGPRTVLNQDGPQGVNTKSGDCGTPATLLGQVAPLSSGSVSPRIFMSSKDARRSRRGRSRVCPMTPHWRQSILSISQALALRLGAKLNRNNALQ